MTEQSMGPGTVLAGRFRLEDLVNETAGAKFWRATDRTLARNVAVNVVDADDPRADALLVAARTSATVTDGHFLRVLDAAKEDGFVYVVNEWGTGISLDHMLAEGPLPARRAAWLVKEVAEAITTAHQHGIAHGRLLPENVMVTEAGSVKLIGFVVDAVLNGRHQPDHEGAPPLSEHESDVVNLAALLYATLVGRWPGSAGSSLPPAPLEHGRSLRPRQVRAGVPRPLDAICDRVLNAEAHQDAMPIETAHEICAALSDFIGDPAGLQVGHDPTTVLDRDEIDRALGATGAHAAVPPTSTGPPDPADTVATTGGQHRAPVEEPEGGDGDADPDAPTRRDPEETQAGTPLFFDDDTGVGWVSPGRTRGRRKDEEQRYRPAPPPPLPDLEPKPLFAPDPPQGRATRRDPDPQRTRPEDRPGTGATRTAAGGAAAGTAASGAAFSTGRSGNTGSLPAIWGPDADTPDDTEDTGGWDTRDAGKSWLRLAAIVAVTILLVIAVVVAFNLGRGSGGGGTTANETPAAGQSQDAPARPVTVAEISDFDPDSDSGEENGQLAPLAIDGDPATAWETLTYFDPLELQKAGVGLLLDLGDPAEVSEVELTLGGRPYGVELLAAPEEFGAPTSTDGLRRVAAAGDAGPKLTLTPDEPVTTRYLVVWLTALPPVDGDYKGRVAEITVRS